MAGPAERRLHIRVAAALMLVVVSGFAVFLIAIDGPWAGPVLARVSATHGIHLGDLVVVAAWLVAIRSFVAIWRATR